jgi:N6-adenosine-specific RNA methylase IME4
MTWPFGDLRPLSFPVILADPPWRFMNFSAAGEKKNPVAHYDCMTTEGIAALPVGQLAAPDAVLFMWATAPMLPRRSS